MVIIVEGIDRVGKTTLCNKLKSIPSAKIIKGIPYITPTDNVDKHRLYSEVLVNVAALLQNELSDLIILDRFHLSHYVYGKLDRNLQDDCWKLVDTMLPDDTILVFVQPTNILLSSAEHGADLQPYYDEFIYCLHSTKLKVIYTNYNKLDTTINIIKELYNVHCCK
jgi:thymidylate kinase